MKRFNSLVNEYYKPYYLCGKLGHLYIEDKNKLVDIGCNRWYCNECRPILKNKLYFDILRNIYSFKLDKHFIITCEGKKFREKYTWEESFRYMNRQWPKFRKVIEYNYGPIDYIALPRSQMNGYCHYHLLINKYVDWSFLNKKRKKYNLGFVSIQKNKDAAEYLATDYWKDHEWIIPKGIRHYRSSRSIKLMDYSNSDLNKIFFDNKYKIEKIQRNLYDVKGIFFDINEYYIYKMIKEQSNRKIDYYECNNFYSVEKCIKNEYEMMLERKEINEKIRKEILWELSNGESKKIRKQVIEDLIYNN